MNWRCHRISVSGRTRNERHAWKDPARRGQERSVRGPVDRSLHLTAEDGELVSQDGGLQLGLLQGAFGRSEQTKDAAQEQIQQRRGHDAALWQIGCRAGLT